MTTYGPSEAAVISMSVTACSDGATQCSNDISYVCVGGAWSEGGDACGGGGGGSECSSGMQMCDGGSSYYCEDGYWVLGGDACEGGEGEGEGIDPRYIALAGGGIVCIALLGYAMMKRRKV